MKYKEVKQLVLTFVENVTTNISKIGFINYTFLTVGVVNLLGLSGDSTATWTSSMFVKLNSTDPTINPIQRQITSEEQSWIAAIFNIGAILGPFPFGFLAFKYGRKKALLSITVPHFLAFLINTFPVNVVSYYIGRFINGVAAGGGYALLPMYVGEIAEESKRGTLAVTLNIYSTLGNSLSIAIGPFLTAIKFNLILTFFPFIFCILFLLLAPESPYHLIDNNRKEKAEKALMLLRSKNKEDVQEELTRIEKEVKSERNRPIKKILKSKVTIKSVCIAVVLLIFQQTSGINVVLFYAQPILAVSGNIFSSDISSVIIGVVPISASFLAPSLANKYGRRVILIVSDIGIFLSLFVFGIYSYIYDETDYDTSSVSFIPITSLVLFLLFYNVGISPIPWAICSELFSSNAKFIGATSMVFACWFSSFLTTYFFNNMKEKIGMYLTFLLYSFSCLTAAVFVYFLVPETRGKSYAEVFELLESRTLQLRRKRNKTEDNEIQETEV